MIPAITLALAEALEELRTATRDLSFNPKSYSIEQLDRLFMAEGRADSVIAMFKGGTP